MSELWHSGSVVVPTYLSIHSTVPVKPTAVCCLYSCVCIGCRACGNAYSGS